MMDRITLIFTFCCLVCFITVALGVYIGWQIARFEQRIDEIETKMRFERR